MGLLKSITNNPEDILFITHLSLTKSFWLYSHRFCLSTHFNYLQHYYSQTKLKSEPFCKVQEQFHFQVKPKPLHEFTSKGFEIDKQTICLVLLSTFSSTSSHTDESSLQKAGYQFNTIQKKKVKKTANALPKIKV